MPGNTKLKDLAASTRVYIVIFVIVYFLPAILLYQDKVLYLSATLNRLQWFVLFPLGVAAMFWVLFILPRKNPAVKERFSRMLSSGILRYPLAVLMMLFCGAMLVFPTYIYGSIVMDSINHEPFSHKAMLKETSRGTSRSLCNLEVDVLNDKGEKADFCLTPAFMGDGVELYSHYKKGDQLCLIGRMSSLGVVIDKIIEYQSPENCQDKK